MNKSEISIIPQPKKLQVLDGFSACTQITKETLTLTEEKTFKTDEYYILEISENQIVAKAYTETGFFYAEQTLEQLKLSYGDKIPCLKIEDYPDYEWRGFMLDTSRNFYSAAFIEKLLDIIALHKLNRFHWHLTDDQGWRIPVPEYPLLAEVSAWRSDSRYSWGEKFGGFYAEQEIIAIVKKAESLHIVVVPEIETPGHASALLAAYPNLGCTGGPYKVEDRYGIFDDVICAGNDEIFEIYDKIFDTVRRLFPGPYLHIGGDECPRVRWAKCPKCQQRIKDKNLTDENELQSYLTVEFAKMAENKGFIPIGWDEVLDGTERLGLPKNLIVQSWRGTEGGIKASSLGHRVIMSPLTDGCYLNFKPYDSVEEPGMHGVITVKDSYNFTPIKDEMSSDAQKLVLGGQGNLWTECIYSSKEAEYMLFPRLCAISEALWTQSKDFESFKTRLPAHKKRLEKLNLLYYKGLVE